jgi:hypothetical protein
MVGRIHSLLLCLIGAAMSIAAMAASAAGNPAWSTLLVCAVIAQAGAAIVHTIREAAQC